MNKINNNSLDNIEPIGNEDYKERNLGFCSCEKMINLSLDLAPVKNYPNKNEEELV